MHASYKPSRMASDLLEKRVQVVHGIMVTQAYALAQYDWVAASDKEKQDIEVANFYWLVK